MLLHPTCRSCTQRKRQSTLCSNTISRGRKQRSKDLLSLRKTNLKVPSASPVCRIKAWALLNPHGYGWITIFMDFMDRSSTLCTSQNSSQTKTTFPLRFRTAHNVGTRSLVACLNTPCTLTNLKIWSLCNWPIFDRLPCASFNYIITVKYPGWN
jgi:hypothetical protein